jgi:hypothetical protein
MRRASLIVAAALVACAAGLGVSSSTDSARLGEAERDTATSTLTREPLRVVPHRVETVTKALRPVGVSTELAVVATVALGAAVGSWSLGRDQVRRAREPLVCCGSSPRAPPLA